MCNTSVYTSILSGIQSAVRSSENVPFNQELIDNLEETVSPIANFYNINSREAILMAFFLNASLKDNEMTKDSIVSHFGNDIVAIAEVDSIIRSLADKKLLMIKGTNKRFKFSYKSVIVSPKAVLAMTEGDISAMDLQQVQSFSDFMLEVNDLILQRMHDIMNTEELIEECNKLLSLNQHLDEVKWILSRKDLQGIDLIFFLNVCVEQNAGEDEVDIDKILKEIADSNAIKMKFKQSIKQGKCLLINNNYIMMAGDMFGLFSMVQLTDKSLDKLFSYMKDLKNKAFQPKMGQLISFESIQEEKLFYNPVERKHIRTLSHALEQEQYEQIMSKLDANGMKKGFTILMYGHPGTGKTSSVKSLARTTGRHIFMVEIPKINSKWVGESEKNISRVFEEYKMARKQFENTPILLFNEADAIFGNRVQVQSSVDKMRNSMQNILLQELEDFEGIFIATTNLADHLDPAFDRRLLYKLEFNKPEDEVRFEILRNAFVNVDADVLEMVNRDYQLTGGQIANVKKKILVREMLESDFDLEVELMSLCEEELLLRKSGKRAQIGFQR